jgi:hypothetical protein
MPADVRHLTVWHAACCNRECQARRASCVDCNPVTVERWAGGHARNGGRGGHVVALWVTIGGETPIRPMMIRYGAPEDTTTDRIWWGWVCLERHPGEHRPRWNEGRMTAAEAFADWRTHNCEGRTHADR